MSAIAHERQNILFGQSYFLRFDPKLFVAMQPYPPLGTLYAASYMRSRGYDVDLFDAMLAESESEWDAALERSQPRIAVLYEDNFNYLSKMCLLRMRQAAFAMIGMARQRGCTVIVAGSDATDHAPAYFSAGADYVLIGEGEQTLGELVDHLLRDGPPLDAILGLAFQRGDEVVINARRPDLKDLDAMPFPAWDLVDIERYRAIWYERQGYYSMNLATSRGCPYHCNWCAKPIWGQRYHVRSPENVAAELAWLKRAYKPDHVWFVDDIFGLIPGWMERFADLVEQRDARLPFKSLQRVDLILKGDTIDALRRAGAQRIWVGAESGSQRILDAMEKGACTPRASRSASSCSSATRARPARTSSARCRWSAIANPTISACRCRIRCLARAFSPPSSMSWAASRTGRIPTTWPCCTTARSAPASIAGCTASCTASFALSARGTNSDRRCASHSACARTTFDWREASSMPSSCCRCCAWSSNVARARRIKV